MTELKTAAQDWRSESRYILCMLALGLWGYLPIVTGRLTNAEGSVITLIRKTGFDWEDRLGRFGPVGRADRIFEEGYFEQPVKLMIGGSMEEGNYSWTDQEMERVVSGSIAEYGMFWSGPSASRDSWQGFYRTWFGMDLPMCSAEEYERIRESEAYRKMSCFPNRGSTGRVGDVFVVKLSD